MFDRELTERDALLGLRLLPGFGAALSMRLLGVFGSALGIFSAPREALERVPGIGPELSRRLVEGPDWDAVFRMWESLERVDAQCIFWGEAAYPRCFERLKSPPVSLFVSGSPLLDGEEWGRAVAIVGTREPDAVGVRRTREVTSQLVDAGYLIVSGGALGIDTVAHETALERGGRTIAILGSGFGHTYPSTNEHLFRKICASGGALLTEFPLNVMPERGNFPQRNRLISVCCGAVVVIQCGRQSGALNTAAHARRSKTPVLTFPGRPGDLLAAGPHRLLRQGAILVETAEDVLDVLEQGPSPAPTQMSLWAEVERTRQRPEGERSSRALTRSVEKTIGPEDCASDEADGLLACLTGQPTHIDELASRTGLSIPEVSAQLLLLELSGQILAHPGQCYAKVNEHI